MPTDYDIFMGAIAQQYRIKKDRLYGTRLAAVVREQVEKLNRSSPEWRAVDFPWDLILDGDEKLRPELLAPSS